MYTQTHILLRYKWKQAISPSVSKYYIQVNTVNGNYEWWVWITSVYGHFFAAFVAASIIWECYYDLFYICEFNVYMWMWMEIMCLAFHFCSKISFLFTYYPHSLIWAHNIRSNDFQAFLLLYAVRLNFIRPPLNLTDVTTATHSLPQKQKEQPKTKREEKYVLVYIYILNCILSLIFIIGTGCPSLRRTVKLFEKNENFRPIFL